jgi:hypothetical protein
VPENAALSNTSTSTSPSCSQCPLTTSYRVGRASGPLEGLMGDSQ